MTFKSLLVHVEPTEVGRERVRITAEVARTFDARVIGVGARSSEVIPDPLGLSIVHLKQAIEEDLARAEALFRQETANVSSVWRSETEFPTLAILRNASGADLIVAGHREGQPPETHALIADLIMEAGTPILMVPPGVKPDFSSIVVGWKNTREARRAVSDALPLLKRAKSVQVLSFASEPGGLEKDDLVTRLRLHGVPAEGRVAADPAGSIASGIEEVARSTKSGLVVVGGYGHSRAREWALGGVTLDLLTKCGSCVLFSH
jgi:nucleotide-binding universal stress UspA family protein